MVYTLQSSRSRPASGSINALLSDCDGVIVDSEVIAEKVLVEVLQYEFARGDIAALMTDMVGMRVIEIISAVERILLKPLTAERRGALQRQIDAEVAERAVAMSGMEAAYRVLGRPIAVVSNSASPRLRRSIERAGLLTWLDPHVYSAEDVGRPKPAPDAYLHAARQLKVPAEECLVIEDSLTGVRAACAAGMRVAGFLGGSHIADGHGVHLMHAGATCVFSSMYELPSLVTALER
jgi:HAD superfamily hydrolase (TIGR01509 family)